MLFRSDQEIQLALKRHCTTAQEREELTDPTKAAVRQILYERYLRTWRAKFDLEEPASLPPMVIELMPGARPAKIRRSYNWSPQQREWLRKHLKKLVDMGVISRVSSNWCCPIVLVLKDDLSWRLCVDPSSLNKYTVPMAYDIPVMRDVLQSSLRDMKWMCRFDFVSMFWQIPLAPESRQLFCFHAGDLGTYCFNRVAMGALNSSAYTQKVMSQIFQEVKQPDGQPLLHNGLLINTDDVLLYAADQTQMIARLELFMKTVVEHHLAIHPGKAELFCTETVYCEIGRAHV